MEKKSGYYFGTEIDEKWWKRYRKKGYFARGLGNYFIDDNGIHFYRYLTKNPLTILFSDIKGIKAGKWHAGRWGHGHIVTKVVWNDSEKVLSSGFILGKNEEETVSIHKFILLKINK